MVTIESKDIKRLEDIKAQPGKEIGLASKQSKLIKDSSKATRRWLASISVFGSDHPVTRIFENRNLELNGADTMIVSNKIVRVETKIKINETSQESIKEVRMDRSQSDFPIGSGVKMGDKRGKVIDHDLLNKEEIKVDFEGAIETISIYNIKRC